MTSRWKVYAVYTLLAAATLWPPVQMALVQLYDLSPWKLGGWGMYATPRPNFVGLEVFEIGADGTAVKLDNPTPELRMMANHFLDRWKWLAELVRPDELIAAVRRQRPDWAHIRVVAYKPVLDRETSMMELRSSAWEYPR